MKQWTTRELSEEAGRRGRSITQQYIQMLCRDGAISGAQKIGRDWLIPDYSAQQFLKRWVEDGRDR